MTTPSPQIITLEGTIGAGKSTLLAQLAEWYPTAHIIREPVDLWTRLTLPDGRSLLALFYEDPARWAFTFQQYAFLTRLTLLQEALHQTPPPPLIIMERSPLTDRHIFATHMINQRLFNPIEQAIYFQWFATYAAPLLAPPLQIKHIWLTTAPSIAHARTQIRARPGESSISLTYLTELHTLHHAWLSPLPSTALLTLDTGTTPTLSAHRPLIDAFITPLTTKTAPDPPLATTPHTP